VAHGLAVLDLRPAHVQGTRFGTRRARPAATGTGGLIGQVVRLLAEEWFHGALSQSLGGRHGHFFHGIEIHVEARPLVAESPSCDNFAPLFGQLMNGGEIFLVESASCHDESLLEVREISPVD